MDTGLRRYDDSSDCSCAGLEIGGSRCAKGASPETRMDTLPYNDFRGFIEAAKKVSEWRLIEGADWNNEIGALDRGDGGAR